MPNIIQYRSKCIGCGICYEMMPELWRMSKKDGKATLLKAVQKRNAAVLLINTPVVEASKKVAQACPVKIIKVSG